MKYREYRPCGPLAPYVKCFWTLEGLAEGSASAEPIFPDGCMEIVLNLADPFQRVHMDGRIERQPGMFLVGQMDRFTRVRSTGPARVLGVRFRPGGARPFLWFPQHEAAGQIVALEWVEGRLKNQVEQAVFGARGDRERIARMEALLLGRLRLWPEPRIAASLHSMLTSAEAPSVRALTAGSGWSERQFRRRFQEAVGIAPKVFARIIRFQRSLRAMERTDFLTAAPECVYYDQAHFIRDFKALAGDTPAGYAARRRGLADHFVLGVWRCFGHNCAGMLQDPLSTDPLSTPAPAPFDILLVCFFENTLLCRFKRGFFGEKLVEDFVQQLIAARGSERRNGREVDHADRSSGFARHPAGDNFGTFRDRPLRHRAAKVCPFNGWNGARPPAGT